MKARGRGVCLGACAVIALLAMPSVVLAKSGFEIQKPKLELEMSLRGSHGYGISIRNLGTKLIILSTSKGDISADYVVRGRVTRDEIDADFGNLGQISVHFHGSPHPHSDLLPPSKCISGRAPIYETGSFDGGLRFNGEHDFTSAALEHVRGTVLRSFRRVCEQPAWLPSKSTPPKHDPEESPTKALLAASKEGDRSVYLFYVASDIPATTHGQALSVALALAGVSERRGKVAISRQAFMQGKAKSLSVSPPGSVPLSATLSLPSPFSGTASYGETADGLVNWTGSLAVSVPGASQTPLTGSSFKAKLCSTEFVEEIVPCLKKVGSSLGSTGLFSFDRRYDSDLQPFSDARLSWSRWAAQ
jgi:hypothetical protein